MGAGWRVPAGQPGWRELDATRGTRFPFLSMTKTATDIVKNEQTMPCGCRVAEMADGRKIAHPCGSCALARAGQLLTQLAQGLHECGQALQHAGQQLGQEKAEAKATQVARAVSLAARRSG